MECDNRGLTKEPGTSHRCTGQVMWKITIKDINNSEILLRSPPKVNLFSFTGRTGLKPYLNLNFCSPACSKIALRTSSYSSSQLLQFASLNLLPRTKLQYDDSQFPVVRLHTPSSLHTRSTLLNFFGPCKLTKVPLL